MKPELPEQQMRVPIPDPTLLTTAALKLSIDNLKELTFSRIESLTLLIETKIAAVNTLKEEKFKELRERLDMVERYRIEAKSDDAKALETAMTAQRELFLQKNVCNEEANAKSEASFTKQIEAIRKEGTIERDALSGRIDALKERIDRDRGKEDHEGQARQQSGWLIPLIVIGVLALLNLVLNVITLLNK